MRNKLVILTCALLMCGSMFGGEDRANFNQRFVEANQLMEEKLWNRSVEIWQELLLDDAENANLNYKIGYCLLNTANRKLDALSFLEKAASLSISKAYDPFSPEEKRAPLETFYYLGRAYHLDYQLDKAIDTYGVFMKKISGKHRLFGLAERQIEMCEEAKSQKSNPKDFIVKNVGDEINGEFQDFSPVISLDESALFFTSRRIRNDSTNALLTDFDTGELNEDIYVSYKDRNGEWQAPELLNINQDEHAATVSVTPDGQQLFIYYDKGGNGNLYTSVLIGETWSNPVELPSDVNTDAWETHACRTADGKTIFFTSDRADGYGSRDIYRIVQLPNGEWSKALTLGPEINTKWEEDSPAITADGSRLYFSSTGHNSMGGFDIFYSDLGEDNVWSAPKNIGYPLNTVDDDVFFVPTANGERAYFSSNKDGGFGKKDIYSVELPSPEGKAANLSVLKGFIYPPENEKLPEDTYVLVTNNKTGESTMYRPRLRDGSFVAVLPPCFDYKIEYFANDKLINTEDMQVPCESSYNEIQKEVYLLPVYLEGEKEYEYSEGATVMIETPENLGKENAISGAFNAENAEAQFARFFIYDFNVFSPTEENFVEFAANVSKIIEIKGAATIQIEASASKVPSSKFRSNEDLSAARAKTAEIKLKERLGKIGVDMSKVTFLDNAELVQGPDYKRDALENKATYEKFQYVKMSAK